MKKIKSFLEKKNLGMTYVELIVVLSIMSIMSAVVLLNYQDFQAKVDIKNLSSEIGQKLVQAQKFAMSGEDVPLSKQGEKALNWKPSYGLFFSTNSAEYKKQFAYFTDLNNSLDISSRLPNAYNYSNNPFSCIANNECLDVVSMNKDYSISSLRVVFDNACEIVGGGGGGTATTGECISGKEKIGNDYKLIYEPTSGYFRDEKGKLINPNAGLHVYYNLFVDLNSGVEHESSYYELINIDMSPVIEEKNRFAALYGLEFKSNGYFFEIITGNEINPNAGYYVFEQNTFVNLNTGRAYKSDFFEEAPNGKYYLITENIGIDKNDGHYVDLPSGKEIFIPNEEPAAYSEKIELYKYNEDTGFYPSTGLFVDLNTLNQKYIPSQFPILCQEDSNPIIGGTNTASVSYVLASDLSVSFKRPDSRAVIQFTSSANTDQCVPSYAEVNFGSSGSAQSKILIYPSGRVQIK